MIDVFRAIILGIVEGLTEFLPISSTGHLIVAEHLMGFKDASEVFTVVIQTGAICAVIWYYRKDLWAKVNGLLSGDRATRKFWMLWVLACLPAGLFGLILEKNISNLANPTMIAWMLIVGGIAMWLIENYHESPPSSSKPKFEKMTIGQALGVGVYQVLSLVPGVSRSGATIMGGMLVGLDRLTATNFSFYLSVPILLLTAIYKLSKHSGQIASVSGGYVSLLVGTVVSFVTAFVVIKWLLRYVSSNTFKPFAYYRIVLGMVLLLFIASNNL